uniref:Uncharacterized protein n=1 Tax=Aegilops tauschii subsp. strangulata TaxID=200361 RepID=A0A453BCQ3_AEGTS
MARVEAVVVCLLIVAMDVVAGVLGIHAEKAQSQAACPTGLQARHRGGRGAGCVARHRQHRRRLLLHVALLLRRPALVAQPADGVLRPGPHMVRSCPTHAEHEPQHHHQKYCQLLHAFPVPVVRFQEHAQNVNMFMIARMVLLVGLALLILGALPNSKKVMAECGVVRHRFLSIGGILCFVHAVFCLVYYVSANAAAREEGRGSGSKPAGGHT